MAAHPRTAAGGAATALVAVVALGASCFESGPLAVATHPLDHDSAVADDTSSDDAVDDLGTPTADDASDVGDSDSAVATDTTSVVTDTSVASDTTSDVADVEVRACLVDGDCAGIGGGDKCAGTVRCVDYGCRPDPATVVHCADPVGGDPCVDLVCNPASGLCEPVEICSCAPEATLACGQELTWSTNDLGPTDHFSAYGCGPPAGSWIERLVGFAPGAGRVRVDLTSVGTTGFHVLGLDGTHCDANGGCVAGAASRAYFQADGTPYVIAVDYAEPNALVKLAATCNITTETECGDKLDDDGDGQSDCADRDCSGVGSCPFIPNGETGVCLNGVDDDQDGTTDCGDTDCTNDAGCLETCDILPISVGCGFHQGAPTGGGRAKATHYSCSPTPAPGIEVVYRFRPSFDGVVNVAFASVDGIAIYLLEDTGRGCTPHDCLQWSTTGFSFDAVNGHTYYFSIDAPAGVEGDFDLHVTCDAR
ncbi:MAG: hypothetical protein U1F43_24235 [Myxococcota bacterium]